MDQHSVGPRRVRRLDTLALVVIEVGAAQLQTGAYGLVHSPVQRRQHAPAVAVDRAVGHCYEIEIADAGHVIAGRRRSGNEQVVDPPERFDLATEVREDG